MKKRDYNITLKQLEELLKILYTYQDDPVVKNDICRLKNFITLYKNNFYSYSSSCDLIEKISEEAELVCGCKDFYHYIASFADEYSPSEINYGHLKISDKKTISLVKGFYKEQDEFFYNQFCYFENEMVNHLKYISTKSGIDGLVLKIESTNEAFAFIPDFCNVKKFSITVHECEHVIDSYINPDFLNQPLIREISSLFMEIISLDYISNKFEDAYKRKYELHSIIKNSAFYVLEKINLLNMYLSNHFLSSDDLYTLFENDGYNKEYITFLMGSSLYLDVSYLVSYFVAIELYYIYLRDKRKALKILKEIILYGKDEELFEILDRYNIKLNFSINKYEKLLKKKKAKN